MSYKVQELASEIIQLKAALAEKDTQYNDLMAQAITLACLLENEFGPEDPESFHMKFLTSPAVQAWRTRYLHESLFGLFEPDTGGRSIYQHYVGMCS